MLVHDAKPFRGAHRLAKTSEELSLLRIFSEFRFPHVRFMLEGEGRNDIESAFSQLFPSQEIRPERAVWIDPDRELTLSIFPNRMVYEEATPVTIGQFLDNLALCTDKFLGAVDIGKWTRLGIRCNWGISMPSLDDAESVISASLLSPVANAAGELGERQTGFGLSLRSHYREYATQVRVSASTVQEIAVETDRVQQTTSYYVDFDFDFYIMDLSTRDGVYAFLRVYREEVWQRYPRFVDRLLGQARVGGGTH